MSEKLKPCRWCGNTRLDTRDEIGIVLNFKNVRCADPGCPAHSWTRVDAWNRRAPLTVADAMQVPEVRALVIASQIHAGHGTCIACRNVVAEALAPFLTAVKEEP